MGSTLSSTASGPAELRPYSPPAAIVPFCVTTTAVPPIVTVPIRDAPSGFGAIRMVTSPPPVPLVVTTVIHETFVDAVHVHVGPVDTDSMASAPVNDAVNDVGPTATEHELDDCEIEKIRLPIVSEPLRVNDPAFGATE